MISLVRISIIKLLIVNFCVSEGTCDWCFQVKPPQFSLSGDAEASKIFCSDNCFSQYRRAIFKQTSECVSCKKTVQNGEDLLTPHGKLLFCNKKCKETYEEASSSSLSSEEPIVDPLIFTPATLLLAQAKALLQSQISPPVHKNNNQEEKETQKENDPKPKLAVKPDHVLKTPTTLSRSNVLRRMTIQDKLEPERHKSRYGISEDLKSNELPKKVKLM